MKDFDLIAHLKQRLPEEMFEEREYFDGEDELILALVEESINQQPQEL